MDFPIFSLAQEKPLDEKVSVPEELSALKVNSGLLQEAVRVYRANQRRGTSSTKTRTEVRGGGRKPWKQKHTGRARAGSNRSPLWRKGGIIFGPKPRDYSIEMPHVKKNLALAHALSARMKGMLCFIREEELTKVTRTKEAAKLLTTLTSVLGSRDFVPKREAVLVVSLKQMPDLWRACRNMKQVETVSIDQLNTYQVLRASCLVVTAEAWHQYLETRYHGV